MMVLYSAALSMFGAKVQIAPIEKAIDFQLVMRPAVMPVVAAMAGYLSSQARPVPG
jgi:hypothetical protein